MPFLSLMVVNMTRRQLLWLCILLLVFQSFLPTLYSMFGMEFQPQLPISGYFIYLLLGYYIAHYNIEKNIVTVNVIGFVAIFAMTLRYLFVYLSDAKEPPLFTYMGIYGFFPAMYIFLSAKKWGGFFAKTIFGQSYLKEVLAYI